MPDNNETQSNAANTTGHPQLCQQPFQQQPVQQQPFQQQPVQQQPFQQQPVQTVFVPVRNIQDPSPAVKKWLVRFLIIIIGLIVLQIPLFLVRNLTGERAEQSSSAAAAIADAWGHQQCLEIISGTTVPEKLTVKTTLHPEMRYRGIYQSVVYSSETLINAEFAKVEKEISLKISDLNGLQNISAAVNGKTVQVALKQSDIGGIITFVCPENTAAPVKCEIKLTLRGSSSFEFLANARSNTIEIDGNWSAPNLAEGAAPDTRTVTDDHFSAKWQINNFGQLDRNRCRAVAALHIPAGTYQQVERVMNYATFFLIVFFFTLIVAELVAKTEIHPVQYLISAGAPVLFYLMLLAFGEKIGFPAAYMVSAVVIVLMVTGYARMFLRKTLPALIMGAVFGASYAVNYFILQMEEFALLSGTIVLALILGVLMALTGKLNAVKTENTDNLPEK